MSTAAEYDDQVTRARAGYAHAVDRQRAANVAALAAGGELFAALRARQGYRIARYGGYDGVPVPCAVCHREIDPNGNERHTIVWSAGELPYARCEQGG